MDGQSLGSAQNLRNQPQEESAERKEARRLKKESPNLSQIEATEEEAEEEEDVIECHD